MKEEAVNSRRLLSHSTNFFDNSSNTGNVTRACGFAGRDRHRSGPSRKREQPGRRGSDSFAFDCSAAHDLYCSAPGSLSAIGSVRIGMLRLSRQVAAVCFL